MVRGLAAVDRSQLAPKFHVVIDTGSTWPAQRSAADLAFMVDPDGSFVAEIGGRTRVEMALDDVAALTEAVAEACIRHGGQARARDLLDGDEPSVIDRGRAENIGPVGPVDLVSGRGVVAVAMLGRISPVLLVGVADVAGSVGNEEIRITPWRSILIPHLDDRPHTFVLAELERLGLATRDDAPEVGLIACIGASCCWSTELDTLTLAAALGCDRPPSSGPGTVIHVSGCAKSCAHHGAASLTFTGRDDQTGFDEVIGPGCR